MKEIFIDDTPMDYDKLPDWTVEECDEILMKGKLEVEKNCKSNDNIASKLTDEQI